MVSSKGMSMTNAMNTREDRRLVSAQAEGVLGEFDHRFEFKDSGEFAVIYGPNGVGKTRLLEIISALCDMNTVQLISLPFTSAQLTFSDGSRLRVRRMPRAESGEELDIAETLRVRVS